MSSFMLQAIVLQNGADAGAQLLFFGVRWKVLPDSTGKASSVQTQNSTRHQAKR